MPMIFWRSRVDIGQNNDVSEDWPLPVRDIPPTDLTLRNNLRYVATNALRDGGAFYRGPITVVDKLSVPATPTLADDGVQGSSSLPASALNVTVSAGNRWGMTTNPATAALTPTVNHAIRVSGFTITGADYYDFFLSTDVAPKWVGRATNAQVVAGGFIVNSVATGFVAGGAAPANAVDIGVVGTQVASTAQPFSNNNAYTPNLVTQIVDCTGWSRLHLYVKCFLVGALPGSVNVPAASIIPFFQPLVEFGSSDWYQGQLQNLNLLASNGQALLQDFLVSIDGAKQVMFLVDNLQTNTNVSLWVEKV